MRRTSSWTRRALVVPLLAVLLFASGCQKKSEPPAGAGAGATTQAPPTLTFTKTPPDTACLQYNPDILTVGVGTAVNFNNSAADTVWVTAPAGCFSPAETTFAVLRGNNGRMDAYHTGSYNLTTRPPACSKVTGGTGPAVVIDSGASGGGK